MATSKSEESPTRAARPPRPPRPEPRKRRLHAYLSGLVQGVGMRATVASLAPHYAATGWVRNLPDGRVEIVAEGREEEMQDFLTALRQEMPRYIRDVDYHWTVPTNEWSGFHIEY